MFLKFIRKHLSFFIIGFLIFFMVAVILLPLYKQQLLMVSRQSWALLPPEWTIEKTQPIGFPSIGKWMLDNQGLPANWLGVPFNNKHLQEPINIIIIDRVSSSSAEAKQTLVNTLESAGYPVRTGHSSGYQGFIGNDYYPMMPEKINHAFANKHFEEDNNHGRIFGPHFQNKSWFFTGAFSRENVAPLKKIKHVFDSFNQARDDVTRKMNDNTSYKIKEYVHLENAFLNNPFFTTGDHDGKAVVLVVEK